MIMKTCTKCGVEKHLDEFQNNRTKPGGKTSQCKLCLAKRQREYAKGPGREIVQAIEKRKAQKPERKAYHAAANKAWIKNNRKRKSAQNVLGKHVRAGKINPLPCFECGDPAEAHHPDYDRPLDVIWLCPRHHKEAHAYATL